MSTENEKKATHAVLYTDGGCRPSRGIGGWGVHGYLFRPEPAKQGAGAKNALPTEKGYEMNKGGVPEITLTHYVDGFGALLPESTNNQAEIMAAIKAFNVVKEQELTNVTFIMDSQYVLQGINDWMPKWAENNWIKADGQEVSNADMWRRCYDVKKDLDEKGVTFTYKWVKGHSGNLGNELADQNATRGIVAGKNGHDLDLIDLVPAQGYWSYKPERSRMFSHANWYFAPGAIESYQTEDGRHVYYLGDIREEEELLGKKIADATFSVVYLNNPDKILNLVRESAAKMGADQYQGLHIGDLREIFRSDIYEELERFGDKLLVRDCQHHRQFTAGNTLLSKEIRPARLAYNAIDALQSLERVLQGYLKHSDESQLRLTDLTGLLYESDTSKKKPVFKLKSHITSAMRSMKVAAGYAAADGGTGQTEIVLTVGLDLPDRNTLAALAGEDTKVTVVTWPESTHAVRYATVIEANGDVGIWSGIYANLHMLKS